MRVEGAVYVLLTPDQADRARPDDQTRQGDDQTHPGDRARPDPDPSLNRLVDEQREMIDWLKREVERKDTILMQMAQRIPELEASPEPRESSVKSSENGSSGDVHPETERRSWWRRLFEA
jgi:hypothetical protein